MGLAVITQNNVGYIHNYTRILWTADAGLYN